MRSAVVMVWTLDTQHSTLRHLAMRLDLAVSRAFSLSRRAAREAVRAGRIEVDGVAADEPGLDVPETAKLAFHPSRPARYRVSTRLSVLAEDDDFVIVDKPAGLLSVPTAEHEKDTLLARTLDYLHHRFGRRPLAFVVHRLDKDTSGSVVFARNRPALHFLQDLFRRHAIAREYLALVEGSVPDSGTFSADLVADAGSARRGVARPGERGKWAVTRYRAVERLAGATLVSIELETGRTHQIRVHFAAAGHPGAGDRGLWERESIGRQVESKVQAPGGAAADVACAAARVLASADGQAGPGRVAASGGFCCGPRGLEKEVEGRRPKAKGRRQ